MRNSKRHHVLAFGPFEMDLTERLLMLDSQPVAIAPKWFDTLAALVENAGHVLGKDELMSRLWPGTFVEESSLSQNIFQLRKILSNGTPGHTYIETIPKRGYRFAAKVTEAGAHRRVLSARDIRSIAVMPFVVLGDENATYLGIGMADAINVCLGRLPGVNVMPTRTMLKYAGRADDLQSVSREYGVDAVIEGAIQQGENRTRVTIQLIDAQSGRTIWAGKYDEDGADVFDVQDIVAEQVASALAPEFSGRPAARSTKHAKALQCFLMGFFFSNKRTHDGLTRAVTYFRDAIRYDPTYARAHAGLADAYFWLAYGETSPDFRRESFELSREHALHAIDIDSSVAEAYAALATVQVKHDHNTGAAESSFRLAIETDPTCAMAHSRFTYFLAAAGRLDEALEASRKAQSIDPLSPDSNAGLAMVLYFLRLYDEAIRYCQIAIDLEPSFSEAMLLLGRCYEQKGMFDEAEIEYASASRFEGHSCEAEELRAHLHAVMGRRSLAQKEVAELATSDRVKPYNIAAIYSALGDDERASAWLERPFMNWTERLRMLRYDPRLDRCRPAVDFR